MSKTLRALAGRSNRPFWHSTAAFWRGDNVEAAVAGDRRSARPLRNRLVELLAACGLGLLVYLVITLGPTRIAAQLHGLSSVLPAVLLITGAKYLFQTAGWRLVLPRDARPPWGESIGATITGDALGYLTWAGPFTGEPIRALMVRGSVPIATGIAAGAIERAVYNGTAALLVWLVLLAVVSVTHGLAMGAALVGVLGAAASSVALWPSMRAGHVTPHPPGWSRGMMDFLQSVRRLWRERRGVVPAVTLLCLAQHTILVGEAYLMLNVLEGGTNLRTAFVFEAVTKIVNTVGMVVPGRLGISEGGSAVLASALGFTASHGLSLALMRRVRALIWAAVGLALLPFLEARARRPRQSPLRAGNDRMPSAPR